MATLQQVDAHAATLDDAVAVALAQFLAAWRVTTAVDGSDAHDDLVDAIMDILASLGPIIETLALDFYEDLREAAGVTMPFRPSGIDLPSRDRVDALAGWSLRPLTLDEPDLELALSRASSGLQRITLGIDRGTIQTNTERDPAGARYARHASANACAFCALLATREGDWLYRTKQSATRVVGVAVGSERVLRGTQPLGEKYHYDCRCVAVPVWSDEDFEEAPYVEAWREAYHEAFDASDGELRSILALMRQSAGLR